MLFVEKKNFLIINKFAAVYLSNLKTILKLDSEITDRTFSPAFLSYLVALRDILPTDLVQRINTAAKGAMSKQLLDLLEQIPPDLRHVANALAEMVRDYQFSKIIVLTQKKKKDD